MNWGFETAVKGKRKVTVVTSISKYGLLRITA